METEMLKVLSLAATTFFGMVTVATAADLPRREPPPPVPVVGKAPVGKAPIGKGPIGKGPIGKAPVVVSARG